LIGAKSIFKKWTGVSETITLQPHRHCWMFSFSRPLHSNKRVYCIIVIWNSGWISFLVMPTKVAVTEPMCQPNGHSQSNEIWGKLEFVWGIWLRIESEVLWIQLDSQKMTGEILNMNKTKKLGGL
jgi:hypothetical protein